MTNIILGVFLSTQKLFFTSSKKKYQFNISIGHYNPDSENNFTGGSRRDHIPLSISPNQVSCMI